jgi:hypothetical protein
MGARESYEPKYYPLIDTDTSGKDKIALCGTNDHMVLDKAGKPYLAEIIEHVFRAEGVSGDVTLHCPYCGSELKKITNNADRSIYVCKICEF